MQSHLFSFVFIVFATVIISSKISLCSISQRVLQIFSLIYSMDFGLIYRCLTPFDVTFMKDLMYRSNFIFLHIAIQFSQHLIKIYSLLFFSYLAPLSQISWSETWENKSGLSFLFHRSAGKSLLHYLAIFIIIPEQYTSKQGMQYLHFLMLGLLWLFSGSMHILQS